MEFIAAWLAALSGWRRNLLVFVLGGATTLTLPPVYLFPLNFLIFPSLLWLLSGVTHWRTAFFVGWWFGFGFFAFGLYWIGNALLVFAAKFAWLLPFASAGLPAFLAVFCGGVCLIAWLGKSHPQRALLFALAWTAAEWIRGHVLTGFPWNLIGYAWSGSDALVQTTAFVGIYGLSFVVVASACLPAAFSAVKRPWIIFLVSAAVPAVFWSGGAIRLENAPEVGFYENVGLRIVQSDIPQHEKWAARYQERNLRKFLDLSLRKRPDWITHIIWPETAATFFVTSKPDLRRILAAAAPPNGLLITGAPNRSAATGALTNAMIAIDSSAQVVGTFDKFHLVPFGEYVPFADFLPIGKITNGKSGFTAGPGPRTLKLPKLPKMSPLICYEVIFPGAVTDHTDRPDWLLNLTNDAWYGVSAGPHQHLAQARVRAVEEGLPMVRAAYTGISAIIDPYGRILQKRKLNDPGVIDTRLPRPLKTPPGYALWGDIPLVAIFVLFGIILLLLRRNINQPKEQ
jgi:apolipoprotein N-acyltransferase